MQDAFFGGCVSAHYPEKRNASSGISSTPKMQTAFFGGCIDNQRPVKTKPAAEKQQQFSAGECQRQ